MSLLRVAPLSIALSACVVLGACSAGPVVESTDLAGSKPDGGRCTPGDTQTCVCLGGGQGTQTCRASGASFGPCAGCGAELPDGLPVVMDGGSSACGTCDGCCDGTTCLAFASETKQKCGPRGAACGACAGSDVCSTSNGACVPMGGGCTTCKPGVTCVSGACTNNIDPMASFKVYIKSASVLVNTTNCPDNWDYFPGGEPDPYVCVGYQSGGTLLQGCSQYVDGTLNATYTDQTGLVTSGGQPFLVPASIFTSGKMQLTMYDYDTGSGDDQMAQGFFPGRTTLDASYSTGMFSCAMNVTFALQ